MLYQHCGGPALEPRLHCVEIRGLGCFAFHDNKKRVTGCWSRRHRALRRPSVGSFSLRAHVSEHQPLGDERDAAVASGKVAFDERLVLARLEVGQRIEPRGSFLIFLGEPNLIPP